MSNLEPLPGNTRSHELLPDADSAYQEANSLATEAVRYCLCRALLATSFSQMPDICEAKTNAYSMEDGMKGATN